MGFDLRNGLKIEWREADGFGSFAAGTATGTNTRREHALLRHRDSEGRDWVLVNALEIHVDVAGRRVPLSSGAYSDTSAPGRIFMHPKGYLHLLDFHHLPFPRWSFADEGLQVVQTLRPVKDAAGFLLEFAFLPGPPRDATLVIRPLVSGRAAEDLHLENAVIRKEGKIAERSIRLAPYDGVPPFTIGWPAYATCRGRPEWYRRVRLPESGADEEALLSPCEISIPLPESGSTWIRLVPGDAPASESTDPPVFLREEHRVPPELAHRLRRSYHRRPRTVGRTETAGFVVDSPSAGVDPETALWSVFSLMDILPASTFAALLRGIEPDTLPFLDQRLLWISLVGEASRRGIDVEVLAEPAHALLADLSEGRHAAAAVTPQGLLRVRAPGHSWWERHDELKRPRLGYPIEIEALWTNALAAGEMIAAAFPGREHRSYASRFLAAAEHIRKLYWNPASFYLHDIIEVPGGSEEADPAVLAPRDLVSSAALVAHALRFEILPPSRGRALLETARRELSDAASPHPRPGLKAFADNDRFHPELSMLWWRCAERSDSDAARRIPLEMPRFPALSRAEELRALAAAVAGYAAESRMRERTADERRARP